VRPGGRRAGRRAALTLRQLRTARGWLRVCWHSRVTKRRPLVIVGTGEFAQIACEYFTCDSPYEVVGFAVERAYLNCDECCDRPVVALDEAAARFDPARHAAYVAVTYTKLNRIRTRLLADVRAQGFTPASYVSSRAFVWRNVTLGEHCFVFEHNVLQHFARVGDNVVLWSGNHIGHRAVLADNCFISSHVVVSGYAEIGRNCFVGVNSCVHDRVRIGDDVVIGAGSVVVDDCPDGQVLRGNPAAAARASSARLFRVGR